MKKFKNNIPYKNMIIIIGLGNPGEKFKDTRHNVGFMALDFFAKKNDFPDFELEKKYESEISEKGKTLLAKPQTFMNKSGIAAGKITRSSQLKAKRLIVIHDDIDLPLGKIKIAKNRGSAGHKGVESVIKAVGNKNLVRIRIGIANNKQDAEQVVLKKFSADQQKIVAKVIKKVAEALDVLIKEGPEKAMNIYNQ